jgi:outer membrane cobalamin receptor
MVNNAAIKAWTARSSMLRLEYYFQGVGQLSVSVFRRDFENFFGSTEFAPTPEFLALYGLNPAIYGSYNVATQYNVPGRARIQGATASYKQALTFLPFWARGVQVFANASAQRASGDASGNFSGYEPRSASWGASLTRPKYVVRLNYTSTSPVRRGGATTVQPGIEPGTFTWSTRVLLVDAIAEYRIGAHLAIFANLRNLMNETSSTEIYGPNTPPHARFRQENASFGSLWTFGVKGSF